jgi:ATP-dependent Clp protease, protease subunit
MTIHAHIPGGQPGPAEPWLPGWTPPGSPPPGWTRPDAAPAGPSYVPVRVWADPNAGWHARLGERLLEKRIVLASGMLDDDAVARLSAQLLTLDAESDQPVRLLLQNLRAELQAAITIMGVLDVMRVTVHGCVSGELSGPALGLLASCPRRTAYPNATIVLAEPRMELTGTATAITVREQQIVRMLDTLYFRLAEVTGRSQDEIREDARRGRVLTAAQAIGYGLIQEQETNSAY